MRKFAAAIFHTGMAALLAAGVLLSAGSPAQAASALCRQLEAELASLGNGRKKVRQPAGNQRAIRQQKQQLAIVQRQMSRRGCSASFSIFGDGGNGCGQLREAAQAMRANLARLQGSSFQEPAFQDNSRLRARLMANIEANRCRERQAKAEEFNHLKRIAPPIEKIARRDEDLLNRLFKGKVTHRQPADSNSIIIPDSVSAGSGTYRTLCVRTCDGYFFPVSFSTTRDFFARDEEACQALCPGVETRLFTHAASGEESEDMVSLMGEPYSALTTAYQYKDPSISKPAGCACNAAKDFSILAGAEKEEAKPAGPLDLAPAPRARPDPALDPETAANLEGGLTMEAVQNLLASRPPVNATPAADAPKIRVVGPAFLPDPSGAINLKAPAPTTVQ